MAKSSSTRQLSRFFYCASMALVVFACGSSDERPPASQSDSDYTVPPRTDDETGDARDVYARGTCSEGETKTCRIYLPAHNDVQPCFVGEQACTDGVWGECGKAALVDANANDTDLDPDTLAP
jgi:hypothetical protein